MKLRDEFKNITLFLDVPKELGIDVATVLDMISKIQNKPLLERGHLYG